MGRRKLDRITDYVREEYNLHVTCLGCGHVTVLCSRTLMVVSRPKKSDRLDVTEGQLKCRNCGARKASVMPTSHDPDPVSDHRQRRAKPRLKITGLHALWPKAIRPERVVIAQR